MHIIERMFDSRPRHLRCIGNTNLSHSSSSFGNMGHRPVIITRSRYASIARNTAESIYTIGAYQYIKVDMPQSTFYRTDVGCIAYIYWVAHKPELPCLSPMVIVKTRNSQENPTSLVTFGRPSGQRRRRLLDSGNVELILCTIHITCPFYFSIQLMGERPSWMCIGKGNESHN